MRRLKLLLNIGLPDARALGLDEHREGEVVSVSDRAAEIMIRKGWAAEVGEGAKPAESRPAPPPASLKAIPPEPEIKSEPEGTLVWRGNGDPVELTKNPETGAWEGEEAVDSGEEAEAGEGPGEPASDGPADEPNPGDNPPPADPPKRRRGRPRKNPEN